MDWSTTRSDRDHIDQRGAQRPCDHIEPKGLPRAPAATSAQTANKSGGANDDEPCTWLVAQTHTHKEAVAILNLKRQGYRTYCPMIQRARRHARRIEQVLRPLFPGYVFVGLNSLDAQWQPIRSTIGVRRLVQFGDQLGLLDPDFIRALRAREKDGAIALPERRFSAGDKVRLIGGPFDGLVGTILSVDARNRLNVLMDILRQNVRVRVEPGRALAVGV